MPNKKTKQIKDNTAQFASLSETTNPDVLEMIKDSADKFVKDTAKPKADTYQGLHGSHQSFLGIGLLEAISGCIVLRGRNGERDHLFPIEKAIEKYWHTKETCSKYALYGVYGWDTLMDICDDLGAKICEAIKQYGQLNANVGLPKEYSDFLALMEIKKNT